METKPIQSLSQLQALMDSNPRLAKAQREIIAGISSSLGNVEENFSVPKGLTIRKPRSL